MPKLWTLLPLLRRWLQQLIIPRLVQLCDLLTPSNKILHLGPNGTDIWRTLRISLLYEEYETQQLAQATSSVLAGKPSNEFLYP